MQVLVQNEYQDAVARDPLLAPPTCCCSCCCSTVVAEVHLGRAWSNKVIEAYTAVRAKPPLRQVMLAHRGATKSDDPLQGDP